MYLSTTPVVGIAADEYWPQVFKHHGPHASLVACFCIRGGKNVRELGKQFLESIEQLPQGSNAELSSALQALIEKTDKNLGSFCMGYFSGETVTIWSMGKGTVLLKRGQKVGKIVQSEPLKIVEGSVRPGDIFVFATDGFMTVSPEPLEGVFGDDEALASLCIPAVQAHEKGSRAAAYMVQAHEGQRAARFGEAVPAKVEQVASPRGTPFAPLAGLFGTFGALAKPVLSRTHQLAGKSKRTKILMVLVICLALLAVSLIVGWSKRQAAAREQKIQQIIQPYEQQLEEAKSKQTLDILAARQLAASALQGAKEKQSQQAEESYERARLDTFIASAQEYFNTISGEKTFETLPTYYNMQLVKSDFIANNIAIGPNMLVFLDTGNNSVVSLAIDKKQPSVEDTSGMTGARDLAVDDDTIYVLGDGVFEGGDVVVEKTDSWSDPQLLGVFGSNLYVLDKGSKTLNRYANTDGSFGSAVSWIKSSPGLDFELITSMAIDGRVWLATSKGEIFTFAQGTKESYQVKGLSTPFTSTLKIYTDFELEDLYVLEAAAGRVVVLSKTGEYKASYISKDLGAATGIVVEPGGKTAYISAGSVVYSLTLE